jgi:pyruvate formate lyase activating enzyme
MTLERRIAVKSSVCIGCHFCRHSVACAVPTNGCIGCGACVIACPQGARQLKSRSDAGVEFQFVLDGKEQKTLGPVSVFNALRNTGRTFQPEEDRERAFCGTGGCGACSVMIDGRLTRSCITALADGMNIVTALRSSDVASPSAS